MIHLGSVWVPFALIYYAAGCAVLAWILTSKPEGYRPITRWGTGFLIGVAGGLWLWPLLLADRWLKSRPEPSGWRRA